MHAPCSVVLLNKHLFLLITIVTSESRTLFALHTHHSHTHSLLVGLLCLTDTSVLFDNSESLH